MDTLEEQRLGPGNFGRIARRTGISKNHVSRVLRGLREPSFDVAADIASAAGVTMETLHEWTLRFRKRRIAKD
jgi:Helix-turn-helix.